MDGLLYSKGGTYNVVSLLYWKPYRGHVSSQDGDLVHTSTLPSKNIHELAVIWFSCYEKYHQGNIS